MTRDDFIKEETTKCEARLALAKNHAKLLDEASEELSESERAEMNEMFGLAVEQINDFMVLMSDLSDHMNRSKAPDSLKRDLKSIYQRYISSLDRDLRFLQRLERTKAELDGLAEDDDECAVCFEDSPSVEVYDSDDNNVGSVCEECYELVEDYRNGTRVTRDAILQTISTGFQEGLAKGSSEGTKDVFKELAADIQEFLESASR